MDGTNPPERRAVDACRGGPRRERSSRDQLSSSLASTDAAVCRRGARRQGAVASRDDEARALQEIGQPRFVLRRRPALLEDESVVGVRRKDEEQVREGLLVAAQLGLRGDVGGDAGEPGATLPADLVVEGRRVPVDRGSVLQGPEQG